MEQKGFTIIEVLVASALLVILGAGFLGLQYIFSRSQTDAWQSYINIEEANRAAMTFAREIRNANESGNGSYPLVTAEDQQIIFYSDEDYDGVVERVRYTVSGTNLIKGIIEPSGEPAVYDVNSEKETIITEYVRNGSDPIFYYYNNEWPQDSTNNPLAVGERISGTRIVKLDLVINSHEDDEDTNYIIETETKIRMLQ